MCGMFNLRSVMSKQRLQWLFLISIFCGQAYAGPVFLREWLMRLSREAASAEDRQASSQALAHLTAGDWEKARLGAERLSVRTGYPGLPANGGGRDIVFHVGEAIEGDPSHALEQVAPEQLGVFRNVEDAAPRFRFISFVASPVKEFNLGLERGMKNFVLGFGMAPSDFQPAIKTWTDTPLGNRIAVIGAGADDLRISELVRNARKEGKVVFFYRDCEFATGTLCSPEVTGAFMKTAGTVLLYDSANARNSLFTLSEAAMVRPLRAGEIRMIMISPADLKTGARMYVSGALVTVSGNSSN
jgi:hypothetical protein